MFSLKNVKKTLVLLCVRSKMLKNHWFYYVFAQKCWKTIGFTVFSLQNVEKPLVLLCFRSNMLKNHWFYCVFAQNQFRATDSGREVAILVWRSYEEPLQPSCLGNHWFYCVFAPQCWKTIGFIVFSLKNVEKPVVLLCFRSKMLKNHWLYYVFTQKC